MKYRDSSTPFVGAWRLISWEQGAGSGDVSRPYGENPEGQIIYTTTGRMSAQLMHPGATLPDIKGLSAEEVIAQVSTVFFAYYGTYSVDASNQIVTHHVKGCLAADWVGTDQVRRFEFLGDNRLTLSAIVEDQLAESVAVSGRQDLVWERIR